MNRIRRITVTLAGLATAVLAFTGAAPAAFAIRVPPPGGAAGGITRSVPGPKTTTIPLPPQVHTVVTGGMPGWQIALIAAVAALLAAVLAVLLDRAWVARRQASAPKRLMHDHLRRAVRPTAMAVRPGAAAALPAPGQLDY